LHKDIGYLAHRLFFGFFEHTSYQNRHECHAGVGNSDTFPVWKFSGPIVITFSQ
jgi:hypothetical protein